MDDIINETELEISRVQKTREQIKTLFVSDL